MAQRILVGVDGSEDAAHAVEWCAAFAKGSDIEIVVCHVISKFGEWLMSVGQVDFQKVEQERTRLLDGPWTAPLREAGVSYKVKLVTGDPVKEILALADAQDAELIVIGRAGHGAAGELLLGGRAARLAHRCTRPLLLVPARRPEHSEPSAKPETRSVPIPG